MPGSSWTGTSSGRAAAGPSRESARLDQELRALDRRNRPGHHHRRQRDRAAGFDRRLAAAAHPRARWKRRAARSARSTCPSAMSRCWKISTSDDKPAARRKRRAAHEPWRYRLYRIGKATVQAGQQGWRMLGYLGRVTVETGEADRRAAQAICASPPWSTRSRKPASTRCPSSACSPS